MGAGLQQNMGKEWGPAVWSKMTKSSPNPVFVDAAERSAKKAENDRKRKATGEAKEQRRRSKCSRIDNTVAARKAYSRHDGIVPDDVADDVSPEFLDESKTRFYETEVVITQVEAEGLERRTWKQAESEEWKSERRK